MHGQCHFMDNIFQIHDKTFWSFFIIHQESSVGSKFIPGEKSHPGQFII